jgi:hypothetical protein
MENHALMTLENLQIDLILKDVDTTGMTEEQKRELALILAEDIAQQQSQQGFNFKPQRVKINKDAIAFVDPLGNGMDELRGVVVHKQKIRGMWNKDDVLVCSSLDCITGTVRDEEGKPIVTGTDAQGNPIYKKRACSSCPYNEWGSAVDEAGNRRKGKACKEQRRIFMMVPGYQLPIVLTLPPTSISVWDDYCSALATAGKSELKRQVILTLSKAGSGKEVYAVLNKPRQGDPVPPMDILKYADIRKRFAATWSQEEVTKDDYDAASDGSSVSDAEMDAALFNSQNNGNGGAEAPADGWD